MRSAVCALLVVAPPMRSGIVKRWRSISLATNAISSSDGVISPESPITSALTSRALSRMFAAETMTPMSTTS